MSRKLDYVRRLLPIGLNHLMVLTMGIIGIKLTSKYVPPAVYGLYSLFLTLTTVGYLFSHAGLINLASRFWRKEEGQGGAYARFLWSMQWRLSIPMSLAIVAVCLLMGLSRGVIWWWVLPWLIIGNFAVALAALASGVLNAQERNWMVLVSGIGASLRSIVPVGLALLCGVSFITLTVGFALHSVCVVAMVCIIFFWVWPAAQASTECQTRWREQLREYGRPFLFLGLGGWLLQSVDRWIVILVFGEDQGGLFSMAASLGAIIPNLAAGALMQLVFPKIFRMADQARVDTDWLRIADRCDKVTWWFLGITLVGLVALGLVTPLFVPWLISPAYGAATTIVFPAGCALAMTQANQFQFLLLQGQQNSKGIVKILLMVAGLKTIGGLIAALVSWQAFLVWCCISLCCAVGMGRFAVRHAALASTSVCR